MGSNDNLVYFALTALDAAMRLTNCSVNLNWCGSILSGEAIYLI